MAQNVVCPNCGYKTNPPGSTRCVSCGSKIEHLAAAKRTREEELERRYQQEGVSLAWMGIALIVQGVLTAALVFGLPMVIPALDFEGSNGMAICIPVWFVGGLLVGMISPGRTFIEPVVASFIVAIPTTYQLVENQTVRRMPSFLYIIMAAMGFVRRRGGRRPRGLFGRCALRWRCGGRGGEGRLARSARGGR